MSPFIALNNSDAHEKRVAIQDVMLLKTLLPYIKPHWKPLAASVLILPLLSFSQVVQPFIVKQALDGPIAEGDFSGLLRLTVMFLGVMLTHYGLRYLQLMLAQSAGQQIIYSVRTALYDHLQRLPNRFFHKTPLGVVITRISSDVENISEVFASGGIAIFADLAVIIGIITAMFLMNQELASVTVLILPVVVITMEFFRRKSRAIYNEIRVQLAKLNSSIQETLTGIDVIQLLKREKQNTDAFEKDCRTYMKINYTSVLYDSAFTAAVELLSFTTIVIVLAYFIWQQSGPHSSALSFGLLVAFLQYIQMLFEPIEEISDKFTIIQSGLASVEKIQEMMGIEPEIQDPLQPVVLHRTTGHIQFKNVTFGYIPGKPVLKEVSFEIRPGEKIALIGSSGAGKSTIIKLMNRQYDPQEGQILMDGVDIRAYTLADLRRNMVLIPQEEFLFSRSVEENITLLYNTPVDPATLAAVSQQVHADVVVKHLPEGYKTILPERGRNLSHGERQLIVFARALWHDPAVLILDEATSSIDPHTESLVQDALDKSLAGRTAVIVAHRLSTIEKVDTVYVVEDGRIVESGSPQHLYHKDSLFRQYVNYYESSLVQQGDSETSSPSAFSF